MLALVDGEVLGDPVFESRVGVIPAGCVFLKADGVGPIPIDLVGGHVRERGFRAGPPGGFEEIERADGIGIEIVERDCGRTIVGRLGGGMDDGIRLDRCD